MNRLNAFVGGLAAFLLISCRNAQHELGARPTRATAAEVFPLASGTWDWAQRDSTCRGNTHDISFSPDRSEMVLTFKAPIDSTGRRVYRYRIIDFGPHLFPHPAHVVRGAMEGETRRTEAGELVIWDLVLATPNRYHWHRTDWQAGGVTAPVVRCSGTRPMEALPGQSSSR